MGTINKRIGYTVIGSAKYQPTTKMRTIGFVKHEIKESGQVYIKVSYGSDLYNHGTFTNYTDAKQFLDECTEPLLLKYAEEFYDKSI